MVGESWGLAVGQKGARMAYRGTGGGGGERLGGRGVCTPFTFPVKAA